MMWLDALDIAPGIFNTQGPLAVTNATGDNNNGSHGVDIAQGLNITLRSLIPEGDNRFSFYLPWAFRKINI